MKRYFIYAGVLATGFIGLVNADTFENTEDMLERPHRPEYNEYDLVITVGQDEVTEESPLSFGPQVFADILDYTPEQSDQLKQAAIAWFLERFGVDFTNAVPCTGPDCLPGSYVNADGVVLYPLANEGTYRVLGSSSKKIPENTPVRLAEWVASFDDVAPGTLWGGSYAAEAGVGDAECVNGEPVILNPTQLVIPNSVGLAFGCYRLTPRSRKRHSDSDYFFFMRSFYPNSSPAVNATPSRSSEYLQMYSEIFGPGFGFLNVAFRGAAGTGNMARASWTYPGSFVTPDYNEWTSAPVTSVHH